MPTRLEKIPIISTGKIELAARPKASATVCAAKPGGFRPSSVATRMDTAIETRAAISSPFSLMFGRSVPLIRSWDTAPDIASSRPAAVDRAAARPPAATMAMTQPGRLAISGLASTMMSLFTVVSSFPTQFCSTAGAPGRAAWVSARRAS